MIEHLSGIPLVARRGECLRAQGGRQVGAFPLKGGHSGTDGFVKFSANPTKPGNSGFSKAFKLGLLGMMMISPGCTGGAKPPEKPVAPVTTQPTPSELPPVTGKDPVQKPVTSEPPKQVSLPEKPQPVQVKPQMPSMQEGVTAQLLQSNDVSELMVGLGQLSTLNNMADADKILFLSQFLERKLPEPVSPQGGPGMPQAPGGMQMMGNPQMILSKVFYPAVASIKNNAAKAEFIREKVLPSEQNAYLQYYMESLLASFTPEAIQDKAFQIKLEALTRALISNESEISRQVGASVLAFAPAREEGVKAPLLLSRPAARDALLKKLLDDPSPDVRGITVVWLASVLKDQGFKDVTRINWFNASLLVSEQINGLADAEAGMAKQGLAPGLLHQISTLENDDLKETLLRTFAERNVFPLSPKGADSLVYALNSFSPAYKEQSRLISDLLGSSRTETAKLTKLALLAFPEHPAFADNLVALCRSDNAGVMKLAIPHVAEIKDPALRESLTMELLDYRKEELVQLVQKITAGHERHRQMDVELEKIEDGSTPLTEAEQKALLEELDRVTRDLPTLGEQVREISDVVEKVAGLCGNLKSDPALQEKLVRGLMDHPHTQIHLFGAYQIQHLGSDTLKAELIRQGTSVERYKKFYRATDDLDVKDDSNLPFHEYEGQTPFESIAITSTLSIPSISDDAVKVPLIEELGRHPVRIIRLDASAAIATLKTGHESLKASILEWAKDPKPMVVMHIRDSLKGFPQNLLVETLQELVNAQDTPDAEGWRSRAAAAVMMPMVSDPSYDAQKVELMMKLVAEPNPIVRNLVASLGIPVQTPAERDRLIQFYDGSNIPAFKLIGLTSLPASARSAEAWKGLAMATGNPEGFNGDSQVLGDPGLRAVAVRNAAQLLAPEAMLAWLEPSIVNSDEAQVRVEVVKVLAALPASQGRDDLLNTLAGDKDPQVRIQLARELSAMKSVSTALTSTLEALCQDPHPVVRIALTPAVRKVSDQALQKKLTDVLLKTDVPEMRAKLAWFLMSTVEDPLSL